MKFFSLFVGSLSLLGLLVSQVKAERHNEEDSREHNERCEHECHNAQNNTNYHVAAPVGCSALNLVDIYNSTAYNWTTCCNALELCYQVCGNCKEGCDKIFKNCTLQAIISNSPNATATATVATITTTLSPKLAAAVAANPLLQQLLNLIQIYHNLHAHPKTEVQNAEEKMLKSINAQRCAVYQNYQKQACICPTAAPWAIFRKYMG